MYKGYYALDEGTAAYYCLLLWERWLLVTTRGDEYALAARVKH